ncbi:hypothetical protein ENUP19_0216G0058 [Entamoeba nuttalli]|uniref:Uncharacterized protein n=2 Tax=Entamoeba nuttalli TaxID=412467 RepID=K2HS22_ENTNP|nr:hypothetical protein ENU1_150130 [Entamoeba nuttalli P19]EKE38855.1 hypothetical protein ENU1_150130 [Entamoeba nuttalli P19]|eukprot:XP_008858808.1 hypothetical protein ENU1_150130 [Entamoeba nuttalli P19]
MSTQRPDNTIITCRPVPLSTRPNLFMQNSYGYSPISAFSMPAPKQVYSPLLVVTPMDTPMVEEDSEENARYDNPVFLDQDVFVFDEQMQQQNQQKIQKSTTDNIISSTNQLKQTSATLSCLGNNDQQQSSPIRHSKLSSDQITCEQPITLNDFGVTCSLRDEIHDDSEGLEEEDSSQDFEESDDIDDEESQVIQEVLERVEQLKKIGDERNKLLHHMIENQK